jgi:hypothetical protein
LILEAVIGVLLGQDIDGGHCSMIGRDVNGLGKGFLCIGDHCN